MAGQAAVMVKLPNRAGVAGVPVDVRPPERAAVPMVEDQDRGIPAVCYLPQYSHSFLTCYLVDVKERDSVDASHVVHAPGTKATVG